MKSISVSSDTDQLLIIHIDGADDIVTCIHNTHPENEDRVPEAVAQLSTAVKK